jgi:hypothetical protein
VSIGVGTGTLIGTQKEPYDRRILETPLVYAEVGFYFDKRAISSS